MEEIMTVLNFEAHDRPILDVLFGNYKFQIPRYQRAYSWTEDQISELWNDLFTNSSSYFLGSFIFNYEFISETGYIEIIDGQQRILTLTILIAAMRDILKDYNSESAKRLQRKCISIEEFDGTETFRVLCGDTTQEYFYNNIQVYTNNIIDSIPKTKEEKQIKDNYLFFTTKIKYDLENLDTKQRKINYLDKLRDKISELIVIQIEISSEDDAYEIFETTNARGVDLNVADLVKNLIFKNIPTSGDRDLAKEYWQQIVDNIQQTGTELKKFLRYYWISKNSFVTEKKLFRAIKKEIIDWEEFLLDLCSASEWFNLFLEGNEDDWKNKEIKNGVKIHKSLVAIKSMNVSQCYVLFLSILRNYSKLGQDPSRIFNFIERFTFNYSAVCKLPTNKVERLFSRYSQDIEKTITLNSNNNNIIHRTISSLFSQLENELKAELPNREMFLEAFSELKYRNSEKGRMLIKYILSEINNCFEITDEKKIDFNRVNIEHLLPQNPDSEWHLSKNEIKDYVNLLGNLTLLGKKLNSRIGNQILKKKIVELEKSQLPITKRFCDEIKAANFLWNKEKIIDRQKQLAIIAYDEIWRF